MFPAEELAWMDRRFGYDVTEAPRRCRVCDILIYSSLRQAREHKGCYHKAINHDVNGRCNDCAQRDLRGAGKMIEICLDEALRRLVNGESCYEVVPDFCRFQYRKARAVGWHNLLYCYRPDIYPTDEQLALIRKHVQQITSVVPIQGKQTSYKVFGGVSLGVSFSWVSVAQEFEEGGDVEARLFL